LPRRRLASLAAAFTATKRRLARPIARAVARSCVFQTESPAVADVDTPCEDVAR
jgi:hypothetical protein